jgi:hypothetical protein
MKNKILSIFVAGIVFASNAFPVDADSYGSYGIYNSSQSPCISLDVTVSDPASDDIARFIDNVVVSGDKYLPDETFVTRINIKNTAGFEVRDVRITAPAIPHVRFISGQVSFDKGASKFEINIGKLAPQEQKTYLITYKVHGQAELPSDSRPFIVFSHAFKATNANCEDVSDSAQIIISKQPAIQTTKGGQPIADLKDVKKYPDAGPEYGIAIVILQSALLFAGHKLRRSK